MRQLMDQFIALILDQRIRLAQEDVVLHDRTVDIPRATVRKDRLGSQRRKVRAEEHQRRILRPESRRSGLRTTVERVVADVELLRHVRLRTDKHGFLAMARRVSVG